MRHSNEFPHAGADRTLPPGIGARAPDRRSTAPVIWTLPGFIGTARIETSFGMLPIQALRKHDPLRTVQGPAMRVARIDATHLDEEFLAANPDAQPIRVPAGAFGPGRPASALLVSPQQKINVSPGQFRQDFRPARDLLGRPGVMRAPQIMVSYYSLECTAPAAVMVEGLCVSVGA